MTDFEIVLRFVPSDVAVGLVVRVALGAAQPLVLVRAYQVTHVGRPLVALLLHVSAASLPEAERTAEVAAAAITPLVGSVVGRGAWEDAR